MFIPISINFAEILEDLNLTPTKENILSLSSGALDGVVEDVIKNIKFQLSLRGLRLKNFKFKVEDKDDFTKILIIEGSSFAFEKGKSFDMKPGFQNAKNVKISKEGNWYTTIPIPKSEKLIEQQNIARGSKESINFVKVGAKSPKKSFVHPGRGNIIDLDNDNIFANLE